MPKKSKKISRFIKWALIIFLFLFIALNIIAYMHAYKFTHFVAAQKQQEMFKSNSSIWETVKMIFTGMSIPRPENSRTPASSYDTVKLESVTPTECWYVKNDAAIGTVILFHGYAASKSILISRSEIFHTLGYNTLLVDLMGSGGSEGNRSTIGFKEAIQVRDAYDYIASRGEKNILLFGVSMGAAAVMKAMNDYRLNVNALILECPFGSMLQTVKARIIRMGAPSFPALHLLMFWGGVQNGFNPYKHNPAEYARNIHAPVMFFRGGADEFVTQQETDSIFARLKGYKRLKTFPGAKHDDYMIHYKDEWSRDVKKFLSQIPNDKK